MIQKKTGSGSKLSNKTGSGSKSSEKTGSGSKTGHTKLKETSAADFFSSKTTGQKRKILSPKGLSLNPEGAIISIDSNLSESN